MKGQLDGEEHRPVSIRISRVFGRIRERRWEKADDFGAPRSLLEPIRIVESLQLPASPDVRAHAGLLLFSQAVPNFSASADKQAVVGRSLLAAPKGDGAERNL